MKEIIIFILACYGLTAILTWGKIFDKIRPPNISFFHCSQCIGFWVGIFIYILFYISEVKLFFNFWFGLFIFGCLSSGTSYLIDNLIGDNGLRIEKNNINEK